MFSSLNLFARKTLSLFYNSEIRSAAGLVDLNKIGESEIMRKILSSFLAIFVCAIVITPLRSNTIAAPKAEDDFQLIKVAEGVFAGISIPTGFAGSNAGFIIGDDGVIVVDTFTYAQATEELIGQIE